MAMLMRGGNAVDAAVAAAMALTVVEPTGCGIGSDALAIVWDGSELHGLNSSGRSPAAWTPARFAGRHAIPQLDWEAVTVPGAVAAWAKLAHRFGRMPCRHPDHCDTVAARGRSAWRPAKLCRMLPAERPRAACRRDVPLRGSCPHT
jgi:hypothetical protein